ncbi:MAG: type II toxin-antitoxin system VapC family toxin [Candidatus Odyssella sp.]|nr:type II toxin-antitoxin system VapC family toxin [Candidatus Odyssella sp.]
MIVIDATVAAKWYLFEADSPKALTVAGSPEDLFAPDWIEVEVASAIARRHRMGGATRADAEALISDWRRDIGLGRIVLQPWQQLLPEAADLALTIAHGLVDCLYLACAKRLGALLLTADDKLYRRAAPVYSSVKLL